MIQRDVSDAFLLLYKVPETIIFLRAEIKGKLFNLVAFYALNAHAVTGELLASPASDCFQVSRDPEDSGQQ